MKLLEPVLIYKNGILEIINENSIILEVAKPADQLLLTPEYQARNQLAELAKRFNISLNDFNHAYNKIKESDDLRAKIQSLSKEKSPGEEFSPREKAIYQAVKNILDIEDKEIEINKTNKKDVKQRISDAARRMQDKYDKLRPKDKNN